jgi:hypothetical protein
MVERRKERTTMDELTNDERVAAMEALDAALEALNRYETIVMGWKEAGELGWMVNRYGEAASDEFDGMDERIDARVREAFERIEDVLADAYVE